MKKTILIVMLVLLLLVALAVLFEKIAAPRYKVICDGFFEGVRRSYPEGAQVCIWFSLIATDTDYRFTVDGEPAPLRYDDKKGYVIEFTMPDHDVTVEVDSRNSMVYEPETEPEPVLLVDSYRAESALPDGNGGYYELMLCDTGSSDSLQLREYRRESADEPVECAEYVVPNEVLDACAAVVKEYDMAGWNDDPACSSEDGVRLVCRFWDDLGNLHRVSNECMPPNGREALDAIHNVLVQALAQARIMQEE
jgi:hypothetical protein